jgi:hypothetical protein
LGLAPTAGRLLLAQQLADELHCCTASLLYFLAAVSFMFHSFLFWIQRAAFRKCPDAKRFQKLQCAKCEVMWRMSLTAQHSRFSTGNGAYQQLGVSQSHMKDR